MLVLVSIVRVVVLIVTVSQKWTVKVFEAIVMEVAETTEVKVVGGKFVEVFRRLVMDVVGTEELKWLGQE